MAYQPNDRSSLILGFGRSDDDFTFADANGNPVPGISFRNAAGEREESTNVVEGDSEVEYFIIEGQQYLVPRRFYIAARYAEAENTSDLISQDDNTVERLQVGAGWWLNPRTLWKFEFVDQDEGVNSGGQIGAGFDGFTSEISVKF